MNLWNKGFRFKFNPNLRSEKLLLAFTVHKICLKIFRWKLGYPVSSLMVHAIIFLKICRIFSCGIFYPLSLSCSYRHTQNMKLFLMISNVICFIRCNLPLYILINFDKSWVRCVQVSFAQYNSSRFHIVGIKIFKTYMTEITFLPSKEYLKIFGSQHQKPSVDGYSQVLNGREKVSYHLSKSFHTF